MSLKKSDAGCNPLGTGAITTAAKAVPRHSESGALRLRNSFLALPPAAIMSCALPARLILSIMAFLMFLVTQMIRVNLYIAVVAISGQQHENETEARAHRSNWSENASGVVLGAFYWSYWATELPGGLLAQKFGGRKVLGIGVTVAAVLNMLLPAACRAHYLITSIFRALQGLALGVTWPVMHWLSARWIPQAERSKFMTSYHGAAVGTVITYPLSGLLIAYFGWNYVFYVTGALTLLWCLAWWILVFDSPQCHPRISEEELEYLKNTIGDLVANTKNENVITPWREILNSKPVWAVMAASQGLMWGTITLSMQIPQYFHQVHHLDIKTNGLFSGVPEIGKFFVALAFSTFIDRSIKKKTLTVTTARKIAVIFCEYVPGVLLAILGFFGNANTVLAVTLLALTCSAGGASSSGSLANIVDLSPNHAGTILGIIKTLTIIPGVISPLLATYFTRNGESNPEVALQWRSVFITITVMYFFCGSAFMLFGSGEVQPWNQTKAETKEKALLLTECRNKGSSQKNAVKVPEKSASEGSK